VEFAVLGLLGLLLGEALPGASACARALPGNKQVQAARTQAAPNHLVTVFVRSRSNGKPSGIPKDALIPKICPNGSWHCNHPLSDDAMPVPVG